MQAIFQSHLTQLEMSNDFNRSLPSTHSMEAVDPPRTQPPSTPPSTGGKRDMKTDIVLTKRHVPTRDRKSIVDRTSRQSEKKPVKVVSATITSSITSPNTPQLDKRNNDAHENDHAPTNIHSAESSYLDKHHKDHPHTSSDESSSLHISASSSHVGLCLILGFGIMFIIDQLTSHSSGHSHAHSHAPATREDFNLYDLNTTADPGNDGETSPSRSRPPQSPSRHQQMQQKQQQQSSSLSTFIGLVIHCAADGLGKAG